MRKSWLLCVLLGAMAWGQAQPVQTPAPPPGPGQASKAAGNATTPPVADVPENAVVLTIVGVCPPSATPASKSASAGKTAAAAGKTAANKPADCKTEITRKEFEKIASALSPNVTPQLKRQLSTVLPKFMAMSEAAKAKGLDKTPQYQETLKVYKMQILTQQLQRAVQEEADQVSPQDLDAYYKKNPEPYEQFSLDRLFVPRYKQAQPAEKSTENAEKLTDEQQKSKEAADKAKQEQGEQDLTKLAEGLRERAAAGEDFTKLQKEAFEAAGIKMDSPTVNLPKVRRTGLPPAHAAVFDLKVGEVSAVIADNGGHYVYKVVSKQVLPLDQVGDEIRNSLKTQRMKEMMDKYANSYHAETNEAYFGPPGPSGPMGGRPLPNRMPHPNAPTPPTQPQEQPQATPQAASPTSQPPAQPAPPSKPN
ncbi:MAG: peptidylprolyl isomerase [Candidatus Sulfotelmatobacter sp.]